MKRHALSLASAGFPVFPLVARDKIPMISKRDGGNGCLDATLDAKQIETWWYGWPNANIGIATAGFLIVDLDGQEGIKSWSSLEDQHGTIPTLAVATGSGGIHLYYRSSVGRNSASKIATKIDTRGDGGYVVAPPSIHPSGTPYAWLNTLDVAQAPAWVEAVITKPDPAPMVATGGIVTDLANAYATTAWAEILRRIATAPAGTRNDQLNAGAYSAGRLIASNLLSRTDAEPALLNAALTTGLRQHESEATIKSGLDAGSLIPVDLKEQIKTPPTHRSTLTFQAPRFKPARFYPPRAS